MKKPLNSFAYAAWLLAVLYLLLMIPELIELFRQPATLESHGSANYIASFMGRDAIAFLRNTVLGSGSLFAFGAIIELIDQIRWNALPPEERDRR